MDRADTMQVWYLGLPAELDRDPDSPATDAGEPVRVLVTGDLLVVDGVTSGAGATARWFEVNAVADATPDAVRRGAAGSLAEAIRIGPVMVTLDNHAVIEFGVRAGVLSVDPIPGPEYVGVRLAAPDTFGVRCAVAAPDTGRPPGGVQRVIYGWYLGMPLVHEVTLPTFYGGDAPAEPDPDLPVTRTYLTAPVHDAAPSSPVRQVPTADGLRTMMSHQNTTDAHPGTQPHTTYGFFVVRGPRGTEDTVRAVAPPPDALPPDPLASAILLGERWAPLSNHLVIEYGVATGLLALRPLEYGGTLTTSFPGDTQAAISCLPTGVVPLAGMGRTTVGTLSIKHADMDLAGGRPNSPVPAGARIIDLVAERTSFSPEEVRVRVGEPVELRLRAVDVMHTLVIDDLDVYIQADGPDAGVGGFVAERPGTYEFHCSLMAHQAAGMTGRLVVEP